MVKEVWTNLLEL